MARSHPVFHPLKMKQRARIQRAIQERVRLRKVTGSMANRTGATIFGEVAVVAKEPEGVGLSGGTRGKDAQSKRVCLEAVPKIAGLLTPLNVERIGFEVRQVNGIDQRGAKSKAEAHEEKEQTRAKGDPGEQKRVGKGKDVGIRAVFVVNDTYFFVQRMHRRTAGEGSLEFGLGAIREGVSNAQAIGDAALGTAVRNELDHFAIGKMTRKKHLVLAPTKIEAEEDQTKPDREHQRMFEEEAEH